MSVLAPAPGLSVLTPPAFLTTTTETMTSATASWQDRRTTQLTTLETALAHATS